MLIDIHKFKGIEKGDGAFQVLRPRQVSPSILTLPVESKSFIIYIDVSKNGLGWISMQGNIVVAYASQQLKPMKKVTLPIVLMVFA